MAFSKDPEAYNPEEQQALIEATTELITIPCPDEKVATHIRHRLYALRRAAINTYDKALLLQGVNKPFEHLMIPIVKVATALKAITIGRSEDKKTLYVGRGAASTDTAQVIGNALKGLGKDLRSEQEAEAAEAFGKIDFTQPAETEREVEKTFDRLGYGTEEIIGNKDGKGTPQAQTVTTTGLSDNEILIKIQSGEALTPSEMKRSQEMKYHE